MYTDIHSVTSYCPSVELVVEGVQSLVDLQVELLHYTIMKIYISVWNKY